jgi:general secretion pathway protein L
LAEALVINLGADHGEVDWLVVDANGGRLGATGHGTLLEAATQAGQRRVIALVPATEVLLTSANVPIRNVTRLRQALPFALEEQVADDVSELQFAIGRRGASGDLPVAVARRDRLEHWRERLREADMEPVGITPAHGLVPTSPTATVWLIDGGTCYIRHPGETPIAIDADSIEEIMLFGDPRRQEREGGAHLTVYLGIEEQARFGEALEGLREELASLELKLLPDGPLPLLAAGAVTQPVINLLQGDYAPRTGIEKMWRPWRVAAALLLALIVATIGRQAAELHRLSAAEAELDAAIEQVFRDAMPGVQRIVNPRAQFEQRLGAIGGTGGGGVDAPFLDAMEVVGAALAGAPEATIEAMSFRNGVMELKLSVPGVDTLDRIQREIVAAGRFSSNILSANPRGDRYEGRLQVSVSGA